MLWFFGIEFGDLFSNEFFEADHQMIFMSYVNTQRTGYRVRLALHAYHLQILFGVDRAVLIYLLVCLHFRSY